MPPGANCGIIFTTIISKARRKGADGPPALRISGAEALALHAMVLAAAEPSRRMSSGRMARRLGASREHLVKVLGRLVAAGLLKASTGPGGGFSETRPASRVSLAEVFRAVSGAPGERPCLLGRPVCGGACLFRGVLGEVDRMVENRLAGVTLAGLPGAPRWGPRPEAHRGRRAKRGR